MSANMPPVMATAMPTTIMSPAVMMSARYITRVEVSGKVQRIADVRRSVICTGAPSLNAEDTFPQGCPPARRCYPAHHQTSIIYGSATAR